MEARRERERPAAREATQKSQRQPHGGNFWRTMEAFHISAHALSARAIHICRRQLAPFVSVRPGAGNGSRECGFQGGCGGPAWELGGSLPRQDLNGCGRRDRSATPAIDHLRSRGHLARPSRSGAGTESALGSCRRRSGLARYMPVHQALRQELRAHTPAHAARYCYAPLYPATHRYPPLDHAAKPRCTPAG